MFSHTFPSHKEAIEVTVRALRRAFRADDDLSNDDFRMEVHDILCDLEQAFHIPSLLGMSATHELHGDGVVASQWEVDGNVTFLTPAASAADGVEHHFVPVHDLKFHTFN